MTYFPDLHTYLHQSSLLLQAYPHTTRITTKYSLPRPPKSKDAKPTETPSEEADGTPNSKRQKRDPSATLTLKTYHPDSGICLKYRTDKAAEVGRLMMGLGKLAKGEIIDMPTAAESEAMTGAGVSIGAGEGLSNGGPAQGETADGDGTKTPVPAQPKTAAQMTQQGQNGQQVGGGGKKKKKGKK